MKHLIEVEVHFLARNAKQATLSIRGTNMATMTLTILHETLTGDLAASDIRGHGLSEHIEVSDGESLTFLARREHDGEIVACAICEVATDVAAQLGYLLLPRAQSNLNLTQVVVRDESGLHQVVESDEDLSAEERATTRLVRLLHPDMSGQEVQELIDTIYQEEIGTEVQP